MALLPLYAKNQDCASQGAADFFKESVERAITVLDTDGAFLWGRALMNAANLAFDENNINNNKDFVNENIISNILAYDASVKDLKEWDESDTRIRTTFREIGGSVFNADQLYKAMAIQFL